MNGIQSESDQTLCQRPKTGGVVAVGCDGGLGDGVTLTRHAAKRIAERFSHLNMVEEWAKAKRQKTGRKKIAKIRRQCQCHLKVTTRSFNGYYYKVSPVNKVVFVVAPPQTIVTVFTLIESPNIRS